MSEDEKEPLSAVDVAYQFIDEADDDWTKEKLLAVLARAGFLLDHEAELDDILEALGAKYNLFDYMSDIYKKKFDVFLNDPEIKAALTAAAAGG